MKLIIGMMRMKMNRIIINNHNKIRGVINPQYLHQIRNKQREDRGEIHILSKRKNKNIIEK